jgi:Protein of unknown function (DUF3305)
MVEAQLDVGVIVEKRKSDSPWIDHLWVPVAVLLGLPDAPPLSVLAQEPEMTRYYLGTIPLVFASVETSNYRDNLASGAPKIWVVLRDDAPNDGVTLLTVTADPAEGEAHTESASNIVDCVPMVPEIAAFLASFVAEHHVEREFIKRKRVPVDQNALGHRRRGEPS